MRAPRRDARMMKDEYQEVLEPSPTFTRREWDEVMQWRMSRMIEAGERIPTLDELLTVMRKEIQETPGLW